MRKPLNRSTKAKPLETMAMEVVDPESNGGEGSASTGQRLKLIELKHKLQQEKLSLGLLQSEHEASRFVTSQEVDKLRRECACLRETVARLKQDCALLRERESRDQERVDSLLEEIDSKERKFNEKVVELYEEIRELEREKRRAQDEADSWMEKFEEASRLLEESRGVVKGKKKMVETNQEKEVENGDSEVAVEVEEGDLRAKRSGKKPLSVENRTKRCLLDVYSNGEGENGGGGSGVGHGGKRRSYREGAGKDSGSYLSPGAGEFVNSGANEASAEVVAAQIPVASNRNQVGRRQVRDKRKRIAKNQTDQRACIGRTASSEEIHCAQIKAEELRSNLKANNPSFIRTMSRSYVSGGYSLTLPTEFCRQNLGGYRMKMTLEDEKGLRHEVKYMGGKSSLSGGWRGFALSHNLEVGDVLMFELREPALFKVYIVKAILRESGRESDGKAVDENADAIISVIC